MFKRRIVSGLTALFMFAAVPIAWSQTEQTVDQRVAVLEAKVDVLMKKFCARRPRNTLCSNNTTTTTVPSTPTTIPNTPTTVPSTPTTTTTTPEAPSTGGGKVFTAATGTEADAVGSFRVECKFTHRAQVDPIVAPGKLSAHLHDFVGNPSTNENSIWLSMVASSTNCTNTKDTAGYWAPTLVAPDGTKVAPERGIFYYRNRPEGYGVTTTYPRDFRMLAGGDGTFPAAYWTCDGESDGSYSVSKNFIPNCGDRKIKMHVYFPPCADGRLDSPDHRSHLAYGIDDGKIETRFPDKCPASHPIKVPQLDFRYRYPITDGTRYKFSSGEVLPHADFWNTWHQPTLDALVSRCLRTPQSCGAPTGS